MGHGVSVNKENFERVIVNFVVRNVCSSFLNDFLHNKDEFHILDESKDGYRNFVYDCMIYSFFHSQNNAASFEIEYKGENFDIRNEFFLYSKDEMLKLANTSGNTELYNDAKLANKDSYLYTWINEHKSDSGILANELFKLGFEMIKRTIDKRDGQENLSRWDASYKQLKVLETLNDDLKQKIDEMRDSIYSRVREFGFILD